MKMSGRSFLAALEEKYEDSDVSTSSELFVLMNMDVAGGKYYTSSTNDIQLFCLIFFYIPE